MPGKVRLLLIILVFASASFVLVAQDDADAEALPLMSELASGEWAQIQPGGDTICSNGTPFWFYVRPAPEETDKLMVFFDGGGACWFGDICDLTANPTYSPFADAEAPAATGIFDYENELNPFVDYHSVFVPYCTADVHIGDAVRTYDVEANNGEVTINHKGYVNATTTLDWVFENVENPSTVFVTGSSAGAIPAPFYAEFVAEAYPDARVEVLADGAGGYRLPEDSRQALDMWNTVSILTELYEGIDEYDELTFEDFYIRVGEAFPNISMTQYNTAADETQLSFLALNGIVDTPLMDLLNANYDYIRGEIENFDTFTAGGDTHTILTTPFVYQFAVDGKPFIEWLTALANGEEVDTFDCSECDEAEVIEGNSE